MKYLISTIKDIESIFIPDFNALFVPEDRFGDIRDKLTDCFEYWELEANDDNAYEKLPISSTDFNPNNNLHSKYFSYKRLENTIDKLSFETEILLLVNKSESEYLSEFIDDILRKNTDTKAKIILDNIFTELNEHIDKLSNLKLNTYQELVSKIFCKSYLNIYRALLKKFSEFYTDYLTTFEEILINLNTGYIERFDDIEDLAYFIFPKNHKKFIEYEYKLKKHDFLNENLKWISKKNDLVRFYKYLEPKKIFIPLGKNPFTRTLKCLEKRYSININKSKETFRFNNIEDKKSIFSFLNDLE